ncbi:MAG: pyridoxal 5'-phosphate synthase glutaminase subunit PdxT [Candidatus Marinimicrobia bacterium]|nr:pyridoxal 5'-phosphate synthase glutaminase subunit PdxT [bacterium]MCG2717018.1 pyridoxal 5'-phosphate synthase glutaminase subunit PdxT [Candidatus Neomarinimicrobiota bacterium]
MNFKSTTIGVLGLQGAFARHIAMLDKLGVQTMQIRYPNEIDNCDGLILPGGESTTISKLLDEMKLRECIQKYNRPMFGTCAGAILLSRNSDDPRIQTLNRVPINTQRNAYGRQVESFIASVDLSFDKKPFNAVFIRAPKLRQPGKEVKVLGTINGEIAFVQYKNILLSTFHPELTDDPRIHSYFIKQLIRK